MKKLLIYSCLFCFLYSCNSPMDRAYSETTFESDLKAIVETDKLDTSDIMLLGLYITMGPLSGADFEGKTYSQIWKEAQVKQLERQAKEDEQNRLAERVREEEEVQAQKLRSTIEVAVYDKGFQEVDWQAYITFKFAFENKSEKDIRAFKGKVVFTDLFDEEVYSINLTYDQEIPALQTATWNAQADFNPYVDKDVLLKRKSLDDLKIKWNPEKVIFTDNSTL